MRYRKGHIAISEDRDVPLLLHVRNARAITQDQLWHLLSIDNVEESPRSMQWRITRLERAGLLERVEAGKFFRQPVYCITPTGMSLLEYRGHTLVSVSSETAHSLHASQIFHALELVNIRIALARNGALCSWKSEPEVASRNMVYSTGVSKDFDALVTINHIGQTHTIGIEYERTVKASARYAEIRETLSRDRSADVVLYLASSHDVLHVLAFELRGTSKRIGFTICDEFCRNLFSATTLLNTGDSNVVRFEELLSARTPGLR